MIAIKLKPSEEDLKVLQEAGEQAGDYFRIEFYEKEKDFITAIGQEKGWNFTVMELFLKQMTICYTRRQKILGSKKLLKMLIRYLIIR